MARLIYNYVYKQSYGQTYMSCHTTKPTKWPVYPSESSLYAQWVANDPSFCHADTEDWSDWAHIKYAENSFFASTQYYRIPKRNLIQNRLIIIMSIKFIHDDGKSNK